MSDIVERLRQRPWRSAAENDYEAKERRQREREEGAETITALRAENERLKVEAAAQYADGAHDGSDRAQDLWAGEITALRAEVERLKIENIQMQAALGYGILAEDERHILPSNPFKCGTCDASKHLRAENERLRAALEEVRVLVFGANRSEARYPLARAALEEKP